MKYTSKFTIHLAAFLVLATTAFAQRSERGQHMDQRLAKITEVLDLTDEQLEQITPIMKANMEQRRAILDSHGMERGKGKRPNFKVMRNARPELQSLKKETHKKLSAILSDEQIAKLDEIEQNMRKRTKDRKQSRPNR